MSLIRPIVRACAVGALRDRTWAQNRVYDSDQTPLAEAVMGTAAKPYIVVYTDNDDRMPNGMEVYNGMLRTMSLAIEIGVASSIRTPEGQIVIQFASTDQGMELAVDVIESQALAALVGDPKSDWGDLFKRLVTKIVKMPSRRGGQGERGVRFAARRTVLMMNTVFDTPPGAVIDARHPIRDFITVARNNPAIGVVDVASIVEKLLETTQAPDWRVAQAYLGLSTQAVKNIVPDGTPLPWGDTEEEQVEEKPFDPADANEYPPLMEEIVLHDERS